MDMNEAGAIRPEQILEIALKRRWLIMIPFCLCLMAGIAFAIVTPSTYEAQTLILVQPQKVPSSYVQSLVSTDINARISTISQLIMSRTNLEKVIKQFNLYPDNEKMFMEEKVDGLRKRIDVNVTRGRRNTDSFSVSFKGQNPRTVMEVANALAAFVIDENLKVREAQAMGTSVFLDSELTAMLKRLETFENSLKEYRERYMGGLPEQLDSNLKILDRLQVRLTDKQGALRDAKNRIAILEAEMARVRGAASSAEGQVDSAGVFVPTATEAQLQLKRLQEQYDALTGRYTQRHPDVLRMKRNLEKQLAKVAAEGETAPMEPAGGQERVMKPAPVAAYDPVRGAQYAELKNEIRTHKDDISRLLEQTASYQRLVEDTPKREQELLSLKRDYQNIKSTYDSLLARKLEAQLAVNMEKKQKGEQFRILDFARLPQKPVSPDLRKIFLLAAAMGLGIGGGIIFLLEYMDTSFRKPDEIETLLDLPVLAGIPFVAHAGDVRKKRLKDVFSLLALLFSLGIISVCGVLIIKGVDPTIAFVKNLMG